MMQDNSYKAVMLATVLALVAIQVNADSLVVLGPSHHGASEVNGHQITNNTYGVGYQHDFTEDFSAQALVYANSFHSTSVSLTAAYKLVNTDYVAIGLTAGVATGYEVGQVPLIQGTDLAPISFVFLEVPIMSSITLGVLHAPDVCADCVSVTSVYLKVPFN